MITYGGDDEELSLFDNAVDKVNTFSFTPTTQEKLDLYGLYKQALLGNNRTNSPGIWDMKAYKKWEAWSKQAGKGKSKCRQEYVNLVNTLVKKYEI